MPPPESNATSPIRRWTAGSNSVGEGAKYSDERRRPKKADRTAARSMMASRAGNCRTKVCAQEGQRGDRDRPVRRAGKASALGAPEAAQDIKERANVLEEKNLSPFHEGRKSTHQAMFARACAESEAWCDNAATVMDRSINRRKKILPGRITLQTKKRTPMRVSSSRLVHLARPSHRDRHVCNRRNLSGGKGISWRTESRVIPKYSNCWVGSTSFPGARGTRRSPQRSWKARRLRVQSPRVASARK